MEKHELTAQQQVLIELWLQLDAICRKHHIPYQLFAGSALGAVRHQGIIPWDDDLDVLMMREDYERFLSAAEAELNQELYYVQKEFSEHWPMFYSKLRKNNTAFMEKQRPKDPLMHQGIYLDIFPCDSLSDSKIIRKAQFLASKVVIAKSLDQRGYLTDNLFKKIFMFCCRMLPSKPFIKLVQYRHRPQTKEVHTFFAAASAYEKNVYPRAWMTETKAIQFHGHEGFVSAHVSELLTKLYGDYMTPPPEKEKEIKVHAEIVDVHKSYTEYLNEQKNMKITTYTRSIR